MSNNTNNSQEQNLKKVIGFKEAMGISVGQIIGAGIMALTGIGIGLTGKSIIFAFPLSAIVTLIAIFPAAFLGATIPTTGGLYKYSSRLLSPRFGLFYLIIFMISNIAIAIYAMSFAQYFEGIVPEVPFKLVAIGILTFFYISNILGVNFAAKIQGAMVIILIAGLVVFVGYGIPQVNYDKLFTESLFTGGVMGFFKATALVSFATIGAQVITELGGEMKNPKRDIPLTIIISTIGVGFVYSVVALVASGVLPVEQVAFKPLTDVARAVLSKPLFLFFIIGGAMMGLATTLNGTLSWVTKSALIACGDGFLPRSLGVVNKKYGTPHRLLTVFYFIGLTPIIFNMSLGRVSMIATALALLSFIFPALAARKVPQKYPEYYEKSLMKIPPKLLNVISYAAAIALCTQSMLLISDLPSMDKIVIVVILVVSAVFCRLVKIDNKTISNTFN